MQNDRQLTDDRMLSERDAERQRLRADNPTTTAESELDAKQGLPEASGERLT
jgi:hypothetical protein